MIIMTASAMRVYDLTLRTYANGEKAYTFSASEIKPNKDGIWGKHYMRVQPYMVSRFEHLKIRNESIVDIVAAPTYYKGKNGNYGLEWEVKDISISDISISTRYEEKDKDTADPQSAEMQKQEATLASILLNFSNNMFT